MNKFKIVYNGKDYTSFSCALETVEIYDYENIKIEKDNFVLKDKLQDILINFLDSFDKKQLDDLYKNIDEAESQREKEEKKKLYTKTSQNEYMFNGLVGFLRKKNFEYSYINETLPGQITIFELDVTLKSVSRFDDKRGYFLCSMLLHNDLSFVDSLVPVDENDDMLNSMLLFRYVSLLKEAFTKGFYKKYVTFKNNDDKLKGTVDIARHVTINCGCDNGKIAYSYRENTVKNSLNMLIVAAYNKLAYRFPELASFVFTRDCEDIVNSLKCELGFYDCSIPNLIKLNSKPIYHPYFLEYEKLRVVCLKILKDEGMNLFASEEIDETNGYLIYIPNLWEKFLQDYFEEIGCWTVEPQMSNDTAISLDTRKPGLLTKPDYVFFDNQGNKKMMLDAKFKPKWFEATKDNGNYLFKNVSDDYNKCIRDMCCLEIHKTGVVFPVKNEEVFKKYLINSFDTFYALGIKVPSISNQDSFYSWNLSFENNVRKQIEEKLVTLF